MSETINTTLLLSLLFLEEYNKAGIANTSVIEYITLILDAISGTSKKRINTAKETVNILIYIRHAGH